MTTLWSSNQGGQQSNQTGSVKIPTSDNKTITVTFGSGKQTPPTPYTRACGEKGAQVEVQGKPDPNFLKEPSCVICADPNESNRVLKVNERLINKYVASNRVYKWLKYSPGPFSFPADKYKALGVYRGRVLYVSTPYDYSYFNEFTLFVLEAATESTQSATGQSTKGTKTQSFIVAPAGTAIPLQSQ